MQNNTEEPKFKKVVNAADGLSLGISMVVAVLIGVGIGLGLRNLTGAGWTLWIGVFIGYTYKKEQQAKYDAEDDDA